MPKQDQNREKNLTAQQGADRGHAEHTRTTSSPGAGQVCGGHTAGTSAVCRHRQCREQRRSRPASCPQQTHVAEERSACPLPSERCRAQAADLPLLLPPAAGESSALNHRGRFPQSLPVYWVVVFHRWPRAGAQSTYSKVKPAQIFKIKQRPNSSKRQSNTWDRPRFKFPGHPHRLFAELLQWVSEEPLGARKARLYQSKRISNQGPS